jgi:lipopolysaccharide export system protein LptA
MRSRALIVAAVSVLALGVGAPVVGAALAAAPAGVGPGLGDSKAPIDISAEGTDIHQADRQVVYYGNVEAIQGTARLNTPKMTVYYVAHAAAKGTPAPSNSMTGSNSVEKIECEGPVYYTTPTQNAKGDHATYIAADDTITMTGNVVVVQDKNVSTGDKLVIEQKTGHSTLTSIGQKSDPSKRVRAVLYPNQNQPQPGAPAGTPPAASKPKAHP